MLPLIVIRCGREELPTRESLPSRVIGSVWKFLAGHEVIEHSRAQLNLTAADYWSREIVSEFARATKHLTSRFGAASLKYAGHEMHDPPHYGWAITQGSLSDAIELVEDVSRTDPWGSSIRLSLATSWSFRITGMPQARLDILETEVDPLSGISTISVSLGRQSHITLAKVVLPFSQPTEEFWRYFRTTRELFPAPLDESHLFVLTGVDPEQRRPIYERLVGGDPEAAK